MADVRRVEPDEVRRRVHEGDALLVCAYDDASKCRGFGIEDALPYSEFRDRSGRLTQDQEIIVFCA